MRNEAPAALRCGSEKHDLAFGLPSVAPVEKQRGDGPAAETFLHRFIALIERKLHARRTRRALLELSDEQLKDIGLSRSQAYGGYERYRRSGSHALERNCG
jgi:uncharacterized protein YjiS (DUF1127 family)